LAYIAKLRVKQAPLHHPPLRELTWVTSVFDLGNMKVIYEYTVKRSNKEALYCRGRGFKSHRVRYFCLLIIPDFLDFSRVFIFLDFLEFLFFSRFFHGFIYLEFSRFYFVLFLIGSILANHILTYILRLFNPFIFEFALQGPCRNIRTK